MSEATITQAIRRYLRACGAWEMKVLGGLGQRAGVPDLLACYRGQFIAIEVKRPGQQPTPRQAAELAAIARAGGIALTATSVADVVTALQGLGPGQLALPLEPGRPQAPPLCCPAISDAPCPGGRP